MATVTQSITVNQETLVAGQALAKFISDVKSSFASGSKIEEVASVAQSALVDLLPALSAMNQIVTEAKSDPTDEAMTGMYVGLLVYKAIMGQK